MFRLVGVGSRPDLLAVVVCAKSTKLAVTLAQGAYYWGAILYTLYIIRSSSSGTQSLVKLIYTRARPLTGRGGG